MSSLREYRFVSTWRVRAGVEEAYAALHDLESYPAWWPEVKEAKRLSEHTFRLRCRSVLPYDLIFETTQAVEDPSSGILEARMTGDLEGFSRWTIRPGPDGAIMRFDEEVVTNKRSLNALAPVARPAFKANHTLMMRHGEAGLRTFLAGLRLGRHLPPEPST
ncbi:MAG: SRPBCC family protein [Actinomycetota bacterium]